MGPYAYFAILQTLDVNKDYNDWNFEEITYEELLLQYQAIPVSDEIINDWWHQLLLMDSYCGSCSRPGKSLDRWGNTLIPPESLDLFINTIESCTSIENMAVNKNELENLIVLLQDAKVQNKYVIHFGV